MIEQKKTDLSKIRADFIKAYGAIYDDEHHGNWIINECLNQQGFETFGQLLAVMRRVVQDGTLEQKIDLLKSYPVLTYKTKEMNATSPTEKLSVKEQLSVGLDQCTVEEGEKLETLNTRYQEKFGFPFIIAVRGAKNRHTILGELERRVDNDFDTEFETAMDQVHIIATFRMNDLAMKKSLA